MQSKNTKREKALSSIKERIKIGQKPHQDRIYSKQELESLEKEIKILEERLSGIKKKKVSSDNFSASADNWYIEIYTVKYGYIKRSERRKKKGASRKKTKKVKTLSLVNTVKSRPGLLESYKSGIMGISPKTHVFKMIQK